MHIDTKDLDIVINQKVETSAKIMGYSILGALVTVTLLAIFPNLANASVNADYDFPAEPIVIIVTDPGTDCSEPEYPDHTEWDRRIEVDTEF